MSAVAAAAVFASAVFDAAVPAVLTHGGLTCSMPVYCPCPPQDKDYRQRTETHIVSSTVHTHVLCW